MADDAEAEFVFWWMLVAKLRNSVSSSRFLSVFKPCTLRSNSRSCAWASLEDGLGRDLVDFSNSFNLLFSTVRSSITPRKSSFSLSGLCSAPNSSSSLPDETKLFGKYCFWLPRKNGGSEKGQSAHVRYQWRCARQRTISGW